MFYKDITLLMMLKLIILLCWCCYALLNGVSTSCLNVVNTRLKVFKQCFMCLFLFSRCLPFAKKFNHLVYDVDHIVENIFLVNGWLTSCLLFVNCLYESQQVVEMLQRSLIILFMTSFHIAENIFFANVSNVLKVSEASSLWSNENIFVIDFCDVEKKKCLMKNIFDAVVQPLQDYLHQSK